MPSPAEAIEQRTDQAKRELTIRESVELNTPQFARALPEHVDEDRFVRMAITSLQTVKHLGECTKQSVLAGLMQAAQLGLEISDVRGQAYLIPRRIKGVYQATFQVGYRGMIDLAARAGVTVDWDIIHQADRYELLRGTEARLAHLPTLDADPGPAIAYYAVARFPDGRSPQFLIRSRLQIEAHRDRFASQRNDRGEISGPWVDHFDSMAVKTVVRMLLDKLPTSAELREAVHLDRAADTPVPATIARPALGGTLEPDPFGAIDSTATDPEPEPEKPARRRSSGRRKKAAPAAADTAGSDSERRDEAPETGNGPIATDAEDAAWLRSGGVDPDTGEILDRDPDTNEQPSDG